MHLPELANEIVVHESPDEFVHNLHCAHIWFCDLDATPRPRAMRSIPLSASERTRATRLEHPLLRARFRARCDFVRRVLGSVTGCDPADLEFIAGPHGKPHLASARGTNRAGEPPLDFNLSHSENVLALAIAFGRHVGLDIEVVQSDAGMFDVARTQFPGPELDEILRSPPDTAMVEFYRFWTRREALAKADGRGVADWPVVANPADARNDVSLFELTFGGKQVIGTLVLSPGSNETTAHRVADEPSRRQCR